MTVEFITFFAVGLLLIVLGLLTWKKQRVTIIHEYHRKNVKKEDLPEYAREMGIAQIVIGIGLCLTGILLAATVSVFAWIPFVANLLAGLYIMHRALTKYNGGWFG